MQHNIFFVQHVQNMSLKNIVNKENFGVGRKTILCRNKKFDVAQKVICCRQKKVDVAQKSVSCRHKQDKVALENYYVLKKVINFFRNGAP